jgi:hypothetical protein
MADHFADFSALARIAENIKSTNFSVMDQINEQQHLRANPVIEVWKSLKTYIEEFERGLDDEHEIAVRLASFGGEIIFHAERIGFSPPNVITFYGITAESDKVQLIQHVSQLSFLLKAVPKLAAKPNRIGFT